MRPRKLGKVHHRVGVIRRTVERDPRLRRGCRRHLKSSDARRSLSSSSSSVFSRNNVSGRRSACGHGNDDTWRKLQQEQIRLDEETELTRTGAFSTAARIPSQKKGALWLRLRKRISFRTDEQRHAVEGERLRVLVEQRRKANEKNRQRDVRHQRQQ